MLVGASTSDAAAILLAVAGTLVFVAMVVAAVALIRSARQLQQAAADLAERSEALMIGVEDAMHHARKELDRVEQLVGSAEAITDTVGSAARVAHTAVAAPLIKAMALGSGARRASRRLRGTR